MRWAVLAVAMSCAVEISAREPVQPGLTTARVDVPAVLFFQVSDATPGQITTALPFRVTFNQASLSPGQALRISVKAEGPLLLPGGVSVPASSFSWTTSQVVNGVGMNGVLSESAYAPVYESRADAKTGRVDLSWSMQVPGGIIRAGTGEVTLRWKFESVTP